MKKIASFLMGLILACQVALPVFAQTTTTPTPNSPQIAQTTTQQQTAAPQATTQQPGKPQTTAPQTTTPQTPSSTDSQQQPGATQTTPPQAPTDGTVSALPAINSDSYIVMNAATGQVLISKNPDKKQYPASITKVLTTAIALNYVNPESDYTITVEDVFPTFPEKYRFSNSTYVAITQDEIVKVRDLLYGTMIQSANDTANALANCAAKLANRSVTLDDGSTSYTGGFIEMMNEEAKNLGCVNSNFVNPHGLFNENHYTTAYDMAMITRYALKVPNFMEYFSQTQYTMGPTNKQPLPRNWGRVKEGMMEPSNENYYPGTIGVKLGWETESNHTGVSVAERNGVRLICVALNCTGSTPYSVQKDMSNLFDYCFNNFNPITYTAEELAPKGFKTPVYDKRGEDSKLIGTATYSTDSDFTVLVHKNFSKNNVLMLPDIPGRYYLDETMPSTLTFSMDGLTAQEASQYMVPNMAALKLDVKVLTFSEVEAQKKAAREALFQKIITIVKRVLIVVLILFLLLLAIRFYNKKKYKKRIMRKKAAAQRRQMQQNPSRNSPPRSRKR